MAHITAECQLEMSPTQLLNEPTYDGSLLHDDAGAVKASGIPTVQAPVIPFQETYWL